MAHTSSQESLKAKKMKYAFSVTIFAIGLVLVVLSGGVPDFQGFNLSQLISSAGSFIASFSIFSLYFEWKGKQELAEYILKEAGVASELRSSGIFSFQDDSANLASMAGMKDAKDIRVYAAYSSRFLKRYQSDLEDCARAGAKVTLITQSKDSPSIAAMKDLGWDAQEIDVNLRANGKLCEALSGHGEVRYLQHEGMHSYSFVIIDSNAFMTLATNATGRAKVPRISGAKGGALYDFLERDWNKLVEQSHAV